MFIHVSNIYTYCHRYYSCYVKKSCYKCYNTVTNKPYKDVYVYCYYYYTIYVKYIYVQITLINNYLLYKRHL